MVGLHQSCSKRDAKYCWPPTDSSIWWILVCSVCRWQHMLRYSSESLESNLWCLFNSNFNTGNNQVQGVIAPTGWKTYCNHFPTSLSCSLINLEIKLLAAKKMQILTVVTVCLYLINSCEFSERDLPPFILVLSVFTGWAKPQQSSQQPSSPAVPGKQAGVREEGVCHCGTELARLLTPVVVVVVIPTMNSVRITYHDQENGWSHTKKWHILKFFNSVYLSLNCC